MTPKELAKSGSEHAHQRAFFAWVNMAARRGFQAACQYDSYSMTDQDWEYKTGQPIAALPELELFHAIPNGGKRDKITASKLKAEGVKAGVLDTFLPVGKKFVGVFDMFNGLYIEFKKPEEKTHKNGGLSDDQMKYKLAVERQAYKTGVAYSWKEAVEIVLEYYGFVDGQIMFLTSDL